MNSHSSASRSSSIDDVRNYWETHPLHSYEYDLGEPRFYDYLDRIKKEDIERFALKFWNFNGFSGVKMLEVGCGPGWFTVQYTRGGARVTAIDLTSQAVNIAKKNLQYHHLNAEVRQANAEALPFAANEFDFVISAGVLHHTPNTFQAFQECFRVLKPGGQSKIALYHKGILHREPFFSIIRFMMRVCNVQHPGAKLASDSTGVDDFVRQYDGAGNPVGIAKNTKDWTALLEKAGFNVLRHELHYFPKRFIPFRSIIPVFVHKLLDNYLGTMIYFELRKPEQA